MIDAQLPADHGQTVAMPIAGSAKYRESAPARDLPKGAVCTTPKNYVVVDSERAGIEDNPNITEARLQFYW